MFGFDFNKEIEEVKQIKNAVDASGWAKRKYLEVYMNARKYPKTAFAVGMILGFLVGKVL